MNNIGVAAHEQPYYSSLPGESHGKSHKVRKRKKIRSSSLPRHERLAMTSLVLLIFAAGISVVFFYAQIVNAGYQVNKIKKEINELDIQTRDMREDVARFSSLERVEEVATTKLGMIKPDGNQMILVKTNPAQADQDLTEASGQTGETADSQTGERSNWIIKALVNLVESRGGAEAG